MSTPAYRPLGARLLAVTTACLALTGFAPFQNWQTLRRLATNTPVRVIVDYEIKSEAKAEFEGSLVTVTETGIVVRLEQGALGKVVERADGTVRIYSARDLGRSIEATRIEPRGTAFDVTFSKEMTRRVSAETGESHKLRGALIGGVVFWAGVTLLAELFSDSNRDEFFISAGFGLKVGAPIGALIGYKMAGRSFDWRVVYEDLTTDSASSIGSVVGLPLRSCQVNAGMEGTLQRSVGTVVAELMRDGVIPTPSVGRR